MSERHEFLSLVGSVANHQALVTGTDLLNLLVDVDGIGDLWALRDDVHDHGGALVVETAVDVVVADLLASLSYDLLEVDLRLRGDLTEHHDEVLLSCGLTGNLRVWVLLEASVEN
jgi:hypothetical protein